MGAAHLHPHLPTLMSIPRTCILAQTLAQKRLLLLEDHEDYKDHKDYEKTKTSTHRSDCPEKSKAQDPSPLQVALLFHSHNSRFLRYPSLCLIIQPILLLRFLFLSCTRFPTRFAFFPLLEEASISRLNPDIAGALMRSFQSASPNFARGNFVC